MHQEFRKKNLAVNLLFIIFASFTIGGSIAIYSDKQNKINILDLPPSSLNGVMFEEHPLTIDVQTSGYTYNNQLISPRESYYYNYQSGSEPELSGFSGNFVDSAFIDENYGSASNMLKPSGAFRIDPAIIPEECSLPLLSPDNEFRNNYGKYGISYDEDVDEAIKLSIQQSHYIDAWAGQIGDEDTTYSIIFPVKNDFILKSIGITFCDDYARFVKWGSTLTSCYNNDWIKGANWSHQTYNTLSTPNIYNNYLGGAPSRIMMPTENVLAKRIYIYRILYSDDYYNWYNVNDTALSTSDYSEYWDGENKLFFKNGVSDRTSFELAESNKKAKIKNDDENLIDPFNLDGSVIYKTIDEYYNDDSKTKPLISSNFLNVPEMTWNDFNLTENKNIKPKYVQIRIEKILYTAGSMFGLGRTSNGKFQGVPEIGEIKLKYMIDENNNNYEDFEDASINYPINNSMLQVNPYDTIPLDFSYYYKADNILANGSMANVNELYFYLNGDSNVKYNLLNSNPNPNITIYNPMNDTYYNPDITKNSWVNLSNGIFAQNPLNSLTNLIDVDINTTTEYGGLYDITLELSDIGSTTLDILYSQKDWTTFGDNLIYENATSYSIKSDPLNDTNQCLFLDEGSINDINIYTFNIPNNYSTTWEKGTNVQFKLLNGGSYNRTVSTITPNGDIVLNNETVNVEYDDYIAFYFNTTLYFNMKEDNSTPTNTYIKRMISICIPISGNWLDDLPNNKINSEFPNSNIILNAPQFKTLRNNLWTKYSFNELGLITESVLREKYGLYMHESNKGGLYHFEFSNLTLITINNPIIQHDFICIDDVEVINFPFADNVMNKFELLYEKNNVWSKSQSITPDTQNVYLINNEVDFENPINKIAFYYYSGDVYKYYEVITPYLGRSINYTFSPLLIAGQENVTARIQWLNTYQYGYTQYDSQFYTRIPNQELFQFGHINIKDIHVTATDITKDWVSYNRMSNLLSRNQNYLEQESQLKCAVLRNAFASAAHSSDININYIQTNIGEFTNIYSANPNENSYFQITVNMPVSSYYDICIRDSYNGDLFDNNSYAIYVDDELYRVISQGNEVFERVSPYLINDILYTSTSSQSYNSLSQIPLGAYDSRPEYQNGEIIRIASDYFKAGFHTIKIKLYNTNAEYIKFRYDQVLLFYQSIRSFNIPVAYFESINSATDYHSITVHIKNNLDGRVKETTTNFQLYTKPYVNFNGGFLPDHVLNYMTRSENSLKQKSYLNADTISDALIDIVFYDNDIDNSTFKYKIDSGAYTLFQTSDIDYSYNGVFYKITKNIGDELSSLSLQEGMHTITVSCKDLKEHESQTILVFYYDVEAPEINLNLEQSNLKVSGSKYNITSDAIITFDVSDNSKIQSIKYTLGKSIKVDNKLQNQTYTYYSRDLNLTDINQLNVRLNIFKTYFDFGDNNVSIEVIDIAGNKETKYYTITREGFYTYLNVSSVNWLNYVEDVDIDIKSIRIKSYTSGESKIRTTLTNIQNQSIKLGVSDIDTYDYIDQHLTLDKSIINGVSLVLKTEAHISRFPLEVQLLTINENIISSGIIIAPSTKQKVTVSMPNVIINEQGEYILRIIPNFAPYNIYEIFLAEGSSRKYTLYGYKDGVQTKLNNYLAFEILGSGNVYVDNFDTYGNIQYRLNDEIDSEVFENGICQTSISNSKHGLNKLSINLLIDGILTTSETIYYLYFDSETHTTPLIDVVSPTSSVQKDEIEVKFYFSYPEYMETYNMQLFIINTDLETEYWLANYTVYWNNVSYNNNYITHKFNSSSFDCGLGWLADSSKYYIKIFVNDSSISNYTNNRYNHEKTSYSQRFTINNEGVKVVIKSPKESTSFNYKFTLDVELQTYDNIETIKSIYYYIDSNYQTKYMLSYNYYSYFQLNEERTYNYAYMIDINKLSDGEHLITIVFVNNNDKTSQDSVKIVKDTHTSANIIKYTPLNPLDSDKILIYYDIPEEYKKIEIYMLYRHTYGNNYGFELLDEITIDINGIYELGNLDYGIYDITFRFIDKAGNIAQDTILIEVKEANSLINFGKAFRNLALTVGGIFGGTGIIIYQNKQRKLKNMPVLINKFEF